MTDHEPWDVPLDRVFQVEEVGEDRFRARAVRFGGVTLGCAALVAARTCDSRSLASFHSYFLRPIPFDRPIELRVERLRDGRRFAHRRVQILVDDRLSFELMASFCTPGDGIEYQEATPDPGPPPDELPSEEDIARAEGWKANEPGPLFGPLEWRWSEIPWHASAGGSSRYNAWVRPRFPLPDDRPLQAAALGLLSDYHSHMSVAQRLGSHFEPFGFTSLDQVLWVHRDLFWNDWWLLTTQCDVAEGGRALTRRTLYARDGRLVASMAQEQLIPGP
jgi:acyl-CoA thioesterase-2